MSESIEQIKIEPLVVVSKPAPPHTKIGSDDFIERLTKELKGGKAVWRSSKALATALEVDTVEMDRWLRVQPGVCVRASKEEGVFMYALTARMEQVENDKPSRPLVTEEDRYALCSAQNAASLLEAMLKKYAVNIHTRSPEAFDKLVQAKSCLEAGIFLFATVTKSEMNKLP